MIRVVIDTNNLPRQLSASSAAFVRVQALIEEGVIEVLMPYVVAEEWRTQRLEHLRHQCEKAGEALKDLLSSEYLTKHSQRPALTQAAGAVQETMNDLTAVSREALEELLQALQTKVIPIANEHGGRVLEAYFGGRSPFASIKSRKDFPDAFVYETVCDLAGDEGSPLVVITADKNFRKQLETLPATSCYEILSSSFNQMPSRG